MQRRLLASVLFASSVLVAQAHTQAGVIYEQMPLRVGGGAGDLDFITDSNQRFWQLYADDFEFAGGATINSIAWWGFYGGNFTGTVQPPAGDETMRVRIYDARASDGLPDNVKYEGTFLNPSRTSTGFRVITTGYHPEFYYEVSFSTGFTALPGIRYWLEVAQVDDVNSHFRWESSGYGAQSYLYMNPLVSDWQDSNTGANLAFQLISIPEPATLIPLTLVIALLTRNPRTRRPRSVQIPAE